MRPVVDAIEADVLILGAGDAGLCATLHAADRSPSLSVAVVVKGLQGRARPVLWTEPVALTRATPAGAGRVSSMVEVGD